MSWPQIAWQITWRGARIWLLLFALLYAVQRTMLYMPFGGEVDPVAIGLESFQVSRLPQPGGASNVVWSKQAEPGKTTILYYHGNGGGLQHRRYQFGLFSKEGWGVYAMSYRGFSGSTGSATEADNIADALAAYDGLRATGIAATDIVIYGESLGTGVAVQVAAQRQARAVVLDAPYSSVADVAADRFPMFLVRWAIKDPYVSTQHIKRVTAPVLILTGTLDEVIPVKFGQRLAAAVPGKVRYVESPKGGHVNLLALGGFAEVKSWVEGTAADRPQKAAAQTLKRL